MGEVTVAEHTEGSVSVVSLDGELDSSTAPAVQERLAALLRPDTRTLLDLTAVPYMSSAGLRTLLLLHRNAQEVHSSVELVGVAPELRSVMAATGFLDFFTVSDSVADAVSDPGPEEGAS